jgi:hypothetical protein
LIVRAQVRVFGHPAVQVQLERREGLTELVVDLAGEPAPLGLDALVQTHRQRAQILPAVFELGGALAHQGFELLVTVAQRPLGALAATALRPQQPVRAAEQRQHQRQHRPAGDAGAPLPSVDALVEMVDASVQRVGQAVDPYARGGHQRRAGLGAVGDGSGRFAQPIRVQHGSGAGNRIDHRGRQGGDLGDGCRAIGQCLDISQQVGLGGGEGLRCRRAGVEQQRHVRTIERLQVSVELDRQNHRVTRRLAGVGEVDDDVQDRALPGRQGDQPQHASRHQQQRVVRSQHASHARGMYGRSAAVAMPCAAVMHAGKRTAGRGRRRSATDQPRRLDEAPSHSASASAASGGLNR